MKPTHSQHWRWAGALCAAALLLGCGLSRDFRPEMARSSPDGRFAARVIMYTPHPLGDSRLRIELATPDGPVELFRDDGMDVWVCFAEVGWSADSRLVGVLANNCYGRSILVAYDTAQRAHLEASRAVPLVQAALRSGYRRELAEHASGEELRWAITEKARRAYLQRHHPEELRPIPRGSEPGIPLE
jgi:hypothetical protein